VVPHSVGPFSYRHLSQNRWRLVTPMMPGLRLFPYLLAVYVDWKKHSQLRMRLPAEASPNSSE
jgi:hypothetical protein